jgi:hypothetical protein
MYHCPHCNVRSVRLVPKWLSSRVFPVTCGRCDGLSYAPGSPGSALAVGNTLLLTGGGFAAIYWQIWLPVAAAVCVALALWVRRIHVQALVALNPEQVARERAREGAGLVLVLLFSWLQ